jgi:hypothetical protein
MDVKAVDTSSLAAQRAEMEPVQTSKERPPFVVDRITSRTSQDAGGRVGRSKSSTERENEQEQREHDQTETADSAETDAELESQPMPIEEHILDVRV